MKIEEIKKDRINELYDLLAELAAHHNAVSADFKGDFPRHPIGDVLKNFAESLDEGTSHIAAALEGDRIAGFCKADISEDKGKIDYLIVSEKDRGKGLGKQLMDWAMKVFSDSNVHSLEVKVVYGNDAARIYEKYGFRTESLLMRRHI